MATKRKTKTNKTWISAVEDRFQGTVVEQPIAVANKAMLAGLGFATQFRANFEAKYDEFAVDGEKVRDQVENSIQGLQNRVAGRVKSRRKQVVKGVESAVNTVLDYTPVAKSSDIKKLNTKLDKVLLKVAK